jgi:hypothetical protein
MATCYDIFLPAGTYYIEVDGAGALWDDTTASFYNDSFGDSYHCLY